MDVDNNKINKEIIKAKRAIKHFFILIRFYNNKKDPSNLIIRIWYVTENISNGVFYKNEGYLCTFCEFRDLCKTTS